MLPPLGERKGEREIEGEREREIEGERERETAPGISNPVSQGKLR